MHFKEDSVNIVVRDIHQKKRTCFCLNSAGLVLEDCFRQGRVSPVVVQEWFRWSGASMGQLREQYGQVQTCGFSLCLVTCETFLLF